MPIQPSENEDKYFAEQEARRRREVREQVEVRAADLAEKERLARAAGLRDVSLADRLTALGITAATAPLLDLMPLVFVAWADGSVSRAERARVMELVEARGFAHGTEPWLFMVSLLERKPDGPLLDALKVVLRDFLKGNAEKGASIVALSRRIAEASGSLFGLGPRIDPREQEIIDRFAEFFAESARREVADDLQG